ncbi:mucin-associated surface protein (MASP), putative, partial [Trypanosoma cruzi marinkellei]
SDSAGNAQGKLGSGQQETLQSSSPPRGYPPATGQAAALTAAENTKNTQLEAAKGNIHSDQTLPTEDTLPATKLSDDTTSIRQAETIPISPPDSNFSATLRGTTDHPIQTAQVESITAKTHNNAAPHDNNSRTQISKVASSNSTGGTAQTAVKTEVETTPDGTKHAASDSNESTKEPDNTTNKTNIATLTDGDGSTAVSHTTSPLLLLLLAFAAAVVAA